MAVDSRAAFSHSPALQCGERVDLATGAICSSRATCERVDLATGESRFVCGDHARPGDAPIAEGTPILLVTVSCAWTIAGSTTAPAEAIGQAIARLRRLADQAGLRVRVGAAVLKSRRYYPSAGAVGAPRARGEG